MVSNNIIFECVNKFHLLQKEIIEKSLQVCKSNGHRLDLYLFENHFIAENVLYKKIAEYLHVPYLDLNTKDIQNSMLQMLPESMARRNEVVVIEMGDEFVSIGTSNPDNIQIIDTLEKKFDKKIRVFFVSPGAIQQCFKKYEEASMETKQSVPEHTDQSDNKAVSSEASAMPLERDEGNDVSMIQVVESILERAIFQNASDIHIEPYEKSIVIRYRIDGILRDVMTLPKKSQMALVARIKVLSSLKLDEHRLPQDGRFTIRNQEYKVAFRVSIMPVFDGEKIVLRILNESAQVLNLEQLGLLDDQLVILRKNISKPHGMILVTGPTGSGKTTTLYTVLSILNIPGVNILTIEDPIEYRISRVNQSQVQPKIGFTFSNGLRSILRQDPDIIMVGEIRDNETAEIAVHAAMTGHLLLSTLHTNDAAGALPRLTEMGVPPFLIASTTNLVIGQRLVRKLCPICRESYVLSNEDLKALDRQLNFSEILQSLKKRGVIKNIRELGFYKPVGCKKCNQEGYQGRIGIYELLELTKKISSCILNGSNATEIKDQAANNGMITMLEDGFIKAKQGVTSIEEVLRVTKE